MSSKISSQPPKRARTSGSAASSVKGPQDVAEEWAQVNSLVERRRLQNRLSQKNYRNKIRTRLEKLESLLDASANGQAQTPEKQCIKEVTTLSPKSYSTKLDTQTEQPVLSATAEPADLWKPLPEFLNFPTDGSFENYAHNSRLDHYSNDCLSEFQTGNEYPSPVPSYVCPTSPSFSVVEAIDVCAAPASPPSDSISRLENTDPLFSTSLDPGRASASTTRDMTSYPHFSGYTEPFSTISASSPCFAGSPLLSYPAARTGTGGESSTVNPANVFPPPNYQHLATAPFPSHQHQLQYIWVPLLVPMLSGVSPSPQSGLHGIPIAPSSAVGQKTK